MMDWRISLELALLCCLSVAHWGSAERNNEN
jgi:hypothetical protein